MYRMSFCGGSLALLLVLSTQAADPAAYGDKTNLTTNAFLDKALKPKPEESDVNKVIEIGSRLELMVDDFLIERMDGVQLKLQTPREMPLADSPLLDAAYATVIKDGDLYRAYYRQMILGYKGPSDSGNPGETTCYAESPDGIKWLKPNLDLFEINGSRANNVILHESPFCHNFSPFLDTRPEKDRGKRFKALAGLHHTGGLYAFESGDGTHWTKMQNTPVITYSPPTPQDFAFDSQNIAFWSEAERCYVCYFRTWKTPHGDLRTISRRTSPDFLHWSEPVAMNPNLPGEHLYTSQTHPYFRAPHIYVALPTRYIAGRVGEQETNAMLGSTDILLMTSRAGATTYDRLFTEAFIRPGLDPARWESRANYVALNVVPTSPSEMSIYHSVSGHRYVLRTDGFVSARAGFTKGELLTKPLSFSGKELILNYSTSAAGSLRIEIQDANGAPLSGLRLDDCPAIIGDEIERHVEWKQKTDLGALQGKPVRLRFVMTECDLYSFRFR